MNNIHKQRLYYIGIAGIGLSLAIGLILYALKQNINVFLTPHQLATHPIPKDYHIRLGGVVKKGSVIRDKAGLGVHFVVTDFKRDIAVNYIGILPDLFREEKGVITEGTFNQQNIFIASQVLAKHDENYMPKNVYKAMREETK